jgi:hypothetical protein
VQIRGRVDGLSSGAGTCGRRREVGGGRRAPNRGRSALGREWRLSVSGGEDPSGDSSG